jgi:hypothetical protein
LSTVKPLVIIKQQWQHFNIKKQSNHGLNLLKMYIKLLPLNKWITLKADFRIKNKYVPSNIPMNLRLITILNNFQIKPRLKKMDLL